MKLVWDYEDYKDEMKVLPYQNLRGVMRQGKRPNQIKLDRWDINNPESKTGKYQDWFYAVVVPSINQMSELHENKRY